MAQQHTDPYLERLRQIQAETAGIDARLDALEAGYALDAKQADEIVATQLRARPARYDDFLTPEELREIAVQHTQALNKGVECDALDYALAASCGVISGLLDIFFVSSPGDGVKTKVSAATKASDKMFEKAVIRFAKIVKTPDGQSWSPRPGSDQFKSALGFLESKVFKVGYDQSTSSAIGNEFLHMSARNHHVKSAGHYPDLIGLMASICNQFTDTSTFLNEGEIVIVNGTGNGFDLRGSSLTAKIFSGFVNWLGHCMSDVAGSSGSQGRGAGLPIPLTEFFQLCNFGRFPNEKGQWQSFASVMTQVYEQGYDLRHGVAMSSPVIINDLLVRAVYTLKRHFYSGIPWDKCLPSKDSREMQRMVTVGIGSMCLVDLGHAAATSWGMWVKFFSELNLVAWARLGVQGAREVQALADRENDNIVAISEDISQEWDSLLERSRALLE